jgi:hypothetical protein
VPSDTLMRLTCNPFFQYVSARTAAWVMPTPEIPGLSSR